MNLTSKQVEEATVEKCNALEKIINDLSETIDPLVFGTGQADLDVQLRLYITMDFLLDTCSRLTKICNTNQPIVAERAQKLMVERDMDSIEMFGKKFSPDTKTYVSVNAANKPGIIAWLQKQESGKELVKLDFNAKSFESYIKKEILDKGAEVPEGVSCFDKPILTVRKSR
jgi:hypothetical protein